MAPIAGVLLDRVLLPPKFLFVLGAGIYILGQFLFARFMTKNSGMVFLTGMVFVRVSGYALVWENCNVAGVDKCGRGIIVAM